MASTIKVTNINTPDGTGNITVDRPLSGSGASLTSLPAANLIGTLPAISGASLTNLPVQVAADNSITLAKMAGGVDGNIISYDASGDPVAVVTGSSGQVLTSAGAGAPPTFAAATGGEDGLTNNSNTTWMTVSADEEVTMPKQVSVLCSGSRVLAVNGITGAGVYYTIIWGTPTYDQNSDMSSSTTFTAPVTGKYLLEVSLHINAVTTAADQVVMNVTTSNQQFTVNNSHTNGFGSEFDVRLSVVCDMDAADTLAIAIRVYGESSNTIVNLTAGNNGYTYLAVALLH